MGQVEAFCLFRATPQKAASSNPVLVICHMSQVAVEEVTDMIPGLVAGGTDKLKGSGHNRLKGLGRADLKDNGHRCIGAEVCEGHFDRRKGCGWGIQFWVKIRFSILP